MEPDQDLLNLQYSQYISQADWQDGFILASSCRRLPEDPANFANTDQSRWWWMTQVGGEIVGYDCDRDKFLGTYRSFDSPEAVEAGACRNSDHMSDNGCGAIQSDLVLAPGASTEVLVLLGIGKSAKAKKAWAKFGNHEACERELAKLKRHWHGLIGKLQVNTPDPDFNHMANVWGAYNALMTFEWSRSCSLVYTGDQRDGFGFRDTVQDMIGVTGMIPSEVKSRLTLMLSGQDSTGGAQPEIRPWSHSPGKMKPTPPNHYRSDDCQWFFNYVPVYVAETGDIGFYDEVVPFADKGSATVLGHLRRAIEFNLERIGANGLPCGLLADWNDCLKLGYKGESVFVAFQVRYGLPPTRRLRASLSGRRSADGPWRSWRSLMQDQEGLLGRLLVHLGHKRGRLRLRLRKGREGQVYLNTQCWAVLSGAASPIQAKQALDTVKKRLASEYGVALCNPPFEKTSVKVMRAVLFNPGNKENGGIFSHTQSWIVLAEIARGEGDRAYEYYRAFMPAAQNDKAEIREIEPYVHCQSTIAPPAKKSGRSRVPWLSGTASWAHYTATHHILGLRPEAGGLRIDPCIPNAWPGFTATREFRGKTLVIEVLNPSGVCRGVKSLSIDGRPIPGNLVPVSEIRDGASIVATLG